MSTLILQVQSLSKEYRIGDVVTKAVDNVDLHITSGEFIAITGKSGSGKSTLLYQISLLDRPTAGTVLYDGHDVTKWKSRRRVASRLAEFGYVFQDYALLAELTALENVYLPRLMKDGGGAESMDVAKDLLSQVGLGDKFGNHPSQLSGGEQQRVSIARALVNNPKILFADEPTANLDSETSLAVMGVFKKLHEKGLTIVMVTHEPEYAEIADRIIEMEDGKII